MTNNISKEAIEYIKKNHRILYEKFADKNYFISSSKPVSIFMAGCPGAGKTEFSKSLIKILVEENKHLPIVRIDADDVRKIIPQYNGRNSDEVQAAVSIAVEKLYDYVQNNNQNVLVDGTLTNYQIAEKNISRALGRKRRVAIFYIYQDPLIAWNFTQKREKLEGRYIPKQAFIDGLFNSYKNVDQLKELFGELIELHLIIKQIDNRFKKTYFNIRKVADYLKIEYTPLSLSEKLKELCSKQ